MLPFVNKQVFLSFSHTYLGSNPKSFCMEFCKFSMHVWILSLSKNTTVRLRSYSKNAPRCECVHAWLFVLCVSVLPCGGLATYPHCAPNLVQWQLESNYLYPLVWIQTMIGWIHKWWNALFPVTREPCVYRNRAWGEKKVCVGGRMQG